MDIKTEAKARGVCRISGRRWKWQVEAGSGRKNARAAMAEKWRWLRRAVTATGGW